jgi:hypothetical protein
MNMKMNKAVLGCALAAGLMAFASDKAQAVVIGNDLFVPANVKLTVSYVSGTSIKTVKVTSKQILAYLNYPKGTQLATWDGDIYAINKTTVLADLTTDGNVFINLQRLSWDEVNKANGAYKYTEVGQETLSFYSDGFVDFPADNTYYFSVNGQYSLKQSSSAISSAGKYTFSQKFSAKALSGSGYDFDVTDILLPVSGSATANGSGKLID